MHKPRLLFLGDSLVDFGNWQHRLPQHRVTSSGVPGEQAEELLWRLPVQTAAAPEAIILMRHCRLVVIFVSSRKKLGTQYST